MVRLEYDTNQWHYAKEIENYPVLTEEEEKELGYLLKNGDIEEQKYARKKLIECNLKLVVSLALEYVNHENAANIVLDMIQEGNIGLIRAVEKYDPSYDNRFATYASWWIRRGIIIAIEKSNTIKKSHKVIMKIEELLEIKQKLEFSLDKIPTDEEIINEYNRLNPTKITLKEYHELLFLKESISLEENKENISIDSNIDIEDEIISEIYNEQLKTLLDSLIDAKLNDKEKDIIIRRYGLKNNDTETLKEIAAYYNCTGECIRQTEVRALEKLHKTLKLSKYKIWR